MKLYDWREDNRVLDYVLRQGKTVIAIEVTSGTKSLYLGGLSEFRAKYKPHKCLTIGPSGIPFETFLKTDCSTLFE